MSTQLESEIVYIHCSHVYISSSHVYIFQEQLRGFKNSLHNIMDENSQLREVYKIPDKCPVNQNNFLVNGKIVANYILHHTIERPDTRDQVAFRRKKLQLQYLKIHSQKLYQKLHWVLISILPEYAQACRQNNDVLDQQSLQRYQLRLQSGVILECIGLETFDNQKENNNIVDHNLSRGLDLTTINSQCPNSSYNFICGRGHERA